MRTARRGVLVAVAILAVLVFVRWFLSPTTDEPLDEGPVVVLGWDPQRVEVALDLLPEPSDERELVLSHPVDDALGELGTGCARPAVRCIRPEPVSTWGEAQAIAELAREESWPSVTVVTSRFHLTRSRLLFDRCLDVPVALVGPDGSGRVPVGRAAYEAAATAASAVAYHGC